MLGLLASIFPLLGFVSGGLSAKVEATWETAGLSATTTTCGEAGTTGEAAATTAEATSIHHAEEDLGVDSAHASTHAAHAATASEHVVGIDQIFAAVIACPLPVMVISKKVNSFTQDAELTESRSRSRRLLRCP